MPPDEIDLAPDASPAAPDLVGDAIAALTPDAVHNSPEFKALAEQNRRLARQAGTNQRAADQARAAVEKARQAAEAQSQADLEGEIATILGEEGIALYNEFADLSQTDPRAAARRLAEIMATRAQSSGPADPPAPAQPATTPQEGTVPAQTFPRGVDAGAPLAPGPAPDPTVALVTELDATYAAVVERNNNPATRNRVTMKERAAGMIAYVASAYIKGGARPRAGS